MNQEQETPQPENQKISLKTLVSGAFILVCFSIIIYTILKVNPQGILEFLTFIAKPLKLFSPILKKALNIFLLLLVKTTETLWIPILLYVLTNIIIKNPLLKILNYVTLVCLFGIFLSHIKFNPIQFNFNSLQNFINFDGSYFIFWLNAYFFILLLTPRMFWKIPSVAFVFIIGVILAAIPNITPLAGFTDFGILTGFAGFLFFVLHFVAGLTQQLADYLNQNDSISIQGFLSYIAKESSDDCKDNQKEQSRNITPMNSKDAAQELE